MKKLTYDEKDLEILIFISIFGRTYPEVIGKTFYKSVQSARNKLSSMKKKKLLKYKLTERVKPKYALVLPKGVRDLLKELGHEPKIYTGSVSQMKHHMIEQITYFHLSKLGKVHRISVYHHSKNYFAIPDLILSAKVINIAVEVEMHQKSSDSYRKYVIRAKKDLLDREVYNRILYVTLNKKIMISIANIMPIWEYLFFIDIDTLIKNINLDEKITPYTQEELIAIKNA